MKKILLVLVFVSSPFLLAGCSSNNTATESQNVSTDSGQEISDIEPTLKQTGFERIQLTDPILFSYLDTNEKNGEDFLQEGSMSKAEQEMVGKQANFSKKQKYNISGLVQILSTSKLAIKSFSYNGSCGVITINPTISNNLKNPFASIKAIQSATSNANYEVDLPSNLSLVQFDSVSIFCSNEPEEPVSTAYFKN